MASSDRLLSKSCFDRICFWQNTVFSFMLRLYGGYCLRSMRTYENMYQFMAILFGQSRAFAGCMKLGTIRGGPEPLSRKRANKNIEIYILSVVIVMSKYGNNNLIVFGSHTAY